MISRSGSCPRAVARCSRRVTGPCSQRGAGLCHRDIESLGAQGRRRGSHRWRFRERKWPGGQRRANDPTGAVHQRGRNGPIHRFRRGRTDVFGPDGGRSNQDLGLVQASLRLERERPRPQVPRALRRSPSAGWDFLAEESSADLLYSPDIDSIASRCTTPPDLRAAGTGLTGHSEQRFVEVEVGPLEESVTIVTLRLVIASPSATPRPLPEVRSNAHPPRPPVRC
jgi:hypothetical protein